MSVLNLDAFNASPLVTDPFEFVIVRGFLNREALPGICADFPKIDRPGSFPVSRVRPGPRFDSLLSELEGPEFAAAISEKFTIDLTDRPTMITVRGRCRANDGQVHTDSDSKIITVLIYFNPSWEASGGRLRLLQSRSLDDVVVELPPEAGTLLAFKRSRNSFHGHQPFEGRRQALQMNWVTERRVVAREIARHTMSLWLKRMNPFQS